MNRFFVITNKEKDKNLIITNRIQHFLEKHHCEVTIQTASDYDEKVEAYTNVSHIPEGVECILVLGGDGTFLQAANDTISRNIPYLGVNLGTLGYLTEVEENNVEEALLSLIEGKAQEDKRMILKGEVIRNNEVIAASQALNDIVLSRAGSLCILNYNVYVNQLLLKGYQADGVIVSTPMGSTGYNMSAGGPIVEPSAKLMVLTPVCPHTLNTRSIILAPEDVITIEIKPPRDERIQEIEVSYDGKHKVKLKAGDCIRIRKSHNNMKILKLNKVSFLEVLHQKMSEA